MSSSENLKLFSEIEKFELININDGEKYDYLQNSDLVIDDKGNIRFLVINLGGKISLFGGNKEFLEIPWECVKKIGLKTIILDADEGDIKRTKI